MISRIRHFISVHHLPKAPTRLLVALSGGADSVALLLILKQMGYDVVAVHCNFHLRGEESNRDEQFVRNLCHEQSVELHVKDFDTENTAKAEGISIEMAARQLRYDWFEEMRTATEATAIAVAHHRDDNAETLLLNLIRGTGIRGLKGMLPQNGHIIRPLLEVSRQDLEDFLKKESQEFVTDSTNLETVYKRNKIRHEVLPLLRQLNPNIDQSLSLTAQRLAEAELLYDHALTEIQESLVEHLHDGIRIQLAKLQNQPAPATILHETLQPMGFSPAEITLIARSLNLQTGKIFEAEHYTALLHRGFLEVRKTPATFSDIKITLGQTTLLPNGNKIRVQQMMRKDLSAIPKCADSIAIDADSITGTLICRSCVDGDRFQPYGMKGTKLVSDYLTDRHRSLIDKKAACCLYDEKGIVWLVGERVAQRVAITETTTKILYIQIVT